MTTETKTGSSFKLWDRRLDGDVLTRGEIRQFCNAIAAGAFGYMIGGAKTNLTNDECQTLYEKFGRRLGGYALTDDHSKFGIEWLRNNPKKARRAGVPVEAVETFREFRFVGVEVVYENGIRANIVAVYRVVYGDGATVDYWASPWQRDAYGG